MNRIRQLLRLEELEAFTHKECDFSIAILDSGIEEHPDLSGRIIAFEDFIQHKSKAYDDYGHGTHIAGIIGGNGKKSNGLFRGVLSKANIIGIKILDHKGNGDYANMRQAFLWILKNHEKYHIRIVNISLGLEHSISREEQMELNILLEALQKADILTVVAAGNNGPSPMSLSILAESEKVISVGCHDLGYQSRYGKNCEEYSGRGPGILSIKKPDLVAPGTDIISCASIRGRKRNNYYTRKSGTSMATAITCGVIGMKLLDNSAKSSESIKNDLLHSARNLSEPWNKQGWGMINPYDFINYEKFG